MTDPTSTAKDAQTLTVRVPFAIRKRGGRKLVVVPEGAPWDAPHPRVDNTMVKAIARAHRWKRLLEGGQFSSITELAEAEKINQSYLCRVLRLTLLAPDIIEMILNGRQPSEVKLEDILVPLPSEWETQKSLIGPIT